MLYAADGSGTCADLHHRVELPPDDGSPVVFRWHWPRGTFAKRMSARELAVFLLPHMPSVAGMFSDNPRIHAEFLVILQKCLRVEVHPTTGAQKWVVSAPDEVLPWIQTAYRTEEDDVVVLSLGCKDAKYPKRAFLFVDAKPKKVRSK